MSRTKESSLGGSAGCEGNGRRGLRAAQGRVEGPPWRVIGRESFEEKGGWSDAIRLLSEAPCAHTVGLCGEDV